MTRRVAVTGVGVVSAAGIGRESFWSAVSSGRSAIGPLQAVPPGSLRFSHGAELTGYQPHEHFSEKEVEFLDRSAQFAVIAAREAVADANLKLTPEFAENIAVITGCSSGGQVSTDDAYRRLWQPPGQRVLPLTIPKTMVNAGTSAITQEFAIQGPAYTVSTACSAANHAIGQAFWLVRTGQAEAAITGGCEAPFAHGFLTAWDALRVVSPNTCRPFSRDRQGLILGEGAAMLVLEPLESALARGARIWGEIAGFGMSADAHHATAPLAAGGARAMCRALADAGVAPEAVGYINAHGTGTPVNDSVETAAIRQVFGRHADRLLVSSTKAVHGHTLGAAGAIEAAATLMALHCGRIPPTANFTEPDPACDLDVVPNVARAAEVQWALSNSFAFGGLNAVLAFRKAAE